MAEELGVNLVAVTLSKYKTVKTECPIPTAFIRFARLSFSLIEKNSAPSFAASSHQVWDRERLQHWLHSKLRYAVSVS